MSRFLDFFFGLLAGPLERLWVWLFPPKPKKRYRPVRNSTGKKSPTIGEIYDRMHGKGG